MDKAELVGKIRELANEVEDMELEGSLDAETIRQLGRFLSTIDNEADSLDSKVGDAYASLESAEDEMRNARSELEGVGFEDLNSAINDLRSVLEDIGVEDN